MCIRPALYLVTISSVFGLLLAASASAQPEAVCGNGDVESGEQCDDGNTDPGDCCSPTCQYESASTECRASAGPCDVEELCDGVSDDCPADVLLPEGTECRASSGLCDPASFCDGISPFCYPIVPVVPILCRASAGPCDPEERCTEPGPDCPPDLRSPPGTICRAQADLCDMVEVCDGVSADCPMDAFEPEGTSCDDGSSSTQNDQCDGSGLCMGTPGAVPAMSPWSWLLVGLFVLASGTGLLAQRRRAER